MRKGNEPAALQRAAALALIRSEKIGRVRTVELAPRKLKEAERWMGEQRALWDHRLEQLDAFLLQQKEKR